MAELTKEETLFVRRLNKTLKSLPKSLNIYVLGADVIVCKKGVSSYDFASNAGYISDSGCVISDLHDDGLEKEN